MSQIALPMAGRAKRCLSTVAVLALSLAAVPNAYATLYDLKADWSDSSNPNGPWTYRAGNVILPSVPNWDKDPGADAAWAPSATGGNFLPAWFKAVANNFDFVTGDIVVHTTDAANGGANGPANVLWTSSSAGIATISGGLWDARQSSPARPQHWDLFVDGVLVDSGDLPGTAGDGISRLTPDTFNLTNVVLDSGDLLELRITRTDLSVTFSGDFIGVNLSIDLQPIAAVPEPATLAIIGMGLIGFSLARQRRRLD